MQGCIEVYLNLTIDGSETNNFFNYPYDLLRASVYL